MKTRRIQVTFHGRVQGVGFRVHAVQSSRGLDVSGWVRNQSDGSVLMDVQGPSRDVEELMKRIDSHFASLINEKLVDERDVVEERDGFKIAH
ncbi:MAG: acylphosphatase [Planctomycetota bacterium]